MKLIELPLGRGKKAAPAPRNPASPWRPNSRILVEEEAPLVAPRRLDRSNPPDLDGTTYLRYEDGAGRKLPERHPSWLDVHLKKAPA